MIAFLGVRLKFAPALKSRPYAMIWLGQTISNLGDGIFYIALAWQVLLMSHSGTAMGIVLIAGTVPRLVFVQQIQAIWAGTKAYRAASTPIRVA